MAHGGVVVVLRRAGGDGGDGSVGGVASAALAVTLGRRAATRRRRRRRRWRWAMAVAAGHTSQTRLESWRAGEARATKAAVGGAGGGDHRGGQIRDARRRAAHEDGRRDAPASVRRDKQGSPQAPTGAGFGQVRGPCDAPTDPRLRGQDDHRLPGANPGPGRYCREAERAHRPAHAFWHGRDGLSTPMLDSLRPEEIRTVGRMACLGVGDRYGGDKHGVEACGWRVPLDGRVG